MKAARLVSPKKFEVVETDVPALEEGRCLIKLERISICGSDIRRVYGRELPEEWYPGPIGFSCHECAGVVVESKTPEFHEGQRVIVSPGADNPGGLVEYITSAPDLMCVVPDEGDLSEWVMCQPSGTVMYSCQKMGSVVGKDVVILGQGAIGLSFTMILAKMGPRQIITVDPLDYRLGWSQKTGATHTINPEKEDVIAAVEGLTEGNGADIVVEAAGSPEAFNMCIRLVRKYGTMMAFGVQPSPVIPIEHELMMTRQPTIIPSQGGHVPEPIVPIKTMVDLKARGIIDPGKLVTHRLPFEDLQRAYDMYLNQEDEVIKVVMSL